MSIRVILCGLFILAGCPELAYTAGPAAVLVGEFVFEKAKFAQCHASTIAETSNGTLVAAWFGGSREGRQDVGIWVSRHIDGQWTSPVEVANGVQSPELRYPTWNPVLYQPRKGHLMLFFKVGPSPREWWGEWMVSADQGKTWTGRRKLPDHGIGPVKNKPIERPDGTILCGSSTEDRLIGWRVHFELTRDAGRTWSRIGPINDGNRIAAIQPTILAHRNGRLQILCRNRNGRGDILQSWSTDDGKSWSQLEASGLPNPNSGIDAVTLADGRQLLVYNHTHRDGPPPRGRAMLNVAVSDDGRRWSAALELERADQGEFSYPAVIQTRDRRVHITYTWHRRRVRHVVLDPARLKPIPIKNGHWPRTSP